MPLARKGVLISPPTRPLSPPPLFVPQKRKTAAASFSRKKPAAPRDPSLPHWERPSTAAGPSSRHLADMAALASVPWLAKSPEPEASAASSSVAPARPFKHANVAPARPFKHAKSPAPQAASSSVAPARPVKLAEPPAPQASAASSHVALARPVKLADLPAPQASAASSSVAPAQPVKAVSPRKRATALASTSHLTPARTPEEEQKVQASREAWRVFVEWRQAQAEALRVAEGKEEERNEKRRKDQAEQPKLMSRYEEQEIARERRKKLRAERDEADAFRYEELERMEREREQRLKNLADAETRQINEAERRDAAALAAEHCLALDAVKKATDEHKAAGDAQQDDGRVDFDEPPARTAQYLALAARRLAIITAQTEWKKHSRMMRRMTDEYYWHAYKDKPQKLRARVVRMCGHLRILAQPFVYSAQSDTLIAPLILLDDRLAETRLTQAYNCVIKMCVMQQDRPWPCFSDELVRLFGLRSLFPVEDGSLPPDLDGDAQDKVALAVEKLESVLPYPVDASAFSDNDAMRSAMRLLKPLQRQARMLHAMLEEQSQSPAGSEAARVILAGPLRDAALKVEKEIGQLQQPSLPALCLLAARWSKPLACALPIPLAERSEHSGVFSLAAAANAPASADRSDLDNAALPGHLLHLFAAAANRVDEKLAMAVCQLIKSCDTHFPLVTHILHPDGQSFGGGFALWALSRNISRFLALSPRALRGPLLDLLFSVICVSITARAGLSGLLIDAGLTVLRPLLDAAGHVFLTGQLRSDLKGVEAILVTHHVVRDGHVVKHRNVGRFGHFYRDGNSYHNRPLADEPTDFYSYVLSVQTNRCACCSQALPHSNEQIGTSRASHDFVSVRTDHIRGCVLSPTTTLATRCAQAPFGAPCDPGKGCLGAICVGRITDDEADASWRFASHPCYQFLMMGVFTPDIAELIAYNTHLIHADERKAYGKRVC
ncbi:hypothetical protein FA09DRAFT_336032 [Tilletiopsis washingtonensis]|uniref:Uncharacterized protein n=1 Tax=Tilletiopsis washingtonensis TaxID=58919 RepID=A0A316ZM46_9BASI|nr:hypothetical protein FA09DRAFT_336032 [Tilletiopsis washingtonensis]PWO01424.1 hypothetical protein FA09DRAFT_336032 [Tilletiopsis washingtonensis]